MPNVSSHHHDRSSGPTEKYVFYVLIVSGKKCVLYRFDGEEYHRIMHGPESVSEVINDAPERVANFTDPRERRQVTVEKFLHHIDKWLWSITNVEQLPIILLAPEKVAGHFRKISKNDKHIIAHIHGNFDEITIPQLKELIRPYIDKMRVNAL